MNNTVPVLTLDGPSGSGKGTVSMRVATALGWHYLDSGALYRVLGLLAERAGVALDDEAGLTQLAGEMAVAFVEGNVVVRGEVVDQLIRSETAGNQASQIAPLKGVRAALLDWQRDCAKSPGLVADGRDMGTVVFPEARCKIFLTASAEARAERRFNQLRLKGFDVNIRQLFDEITARDERDSSRAVSPLKPACDAVLLDTTDISIDAVVGRVLAAVRKCFG